MILKKMTLTDFKGIRYREIELGNKTIVSGFNGSGKTTLFSAHLWLFCDRDADLKSNPNIRPDDGRECIPRVEEEWDVDGTTITIAKFQKKSVTNSKDGGQPKVSLTNGYEINGVSKTERDFKKELSDRGFNFDVFLPLSHIDVFTGQKVQEMRSMLFGMATSKTDAEIARMTSGCGKVAELLEKYRMDEISAMQKASMKRADEQLKAIPNQIIGLEKAKVDIDVAECELARAQLLREIKDLENQLTSAASHVSEVDRKIDELEAQREHIQRKALNDLNLKKTSILARIDELEADNSKHQLSLSVAEDQIERWLALIKMSESELRESQESYTRVASRSFDELELNKILEEKFDESSCICPTCGRIFPDDQINILRERFEYGKSERIAEQERLRDKFYRDQELELDIITENGTKAKSKIREAEDLKTDLDGRVVEEKAIVAKIEGEIEKLNEKLGEFPIGIDVGSDPEYISLGYQISKLQKERCALKDESLWISEKQKELDDKRCQLKFYESQIAISENNVRIDEQIAELEHKKRVYAQNKADAELILDQLDKVSRTKNELLEEDINSHFTDIRFELYEWQKNGEYKESCRPFVYDCRYDEWRSLSTSSNTALAVYGKLMIVNGIQKFYKQKLPVFVDFAAELDKKSMNDISVDFQTVFLSVSNRELKVEDI